MVLDSSTSEAASSSAVRAISSRYSPTLSRPSISRVALMVRVAMSPS
jgi:mevalonate pyrophosphate decarboxylase